MKFQLLIASAVAIVIGCNEPAPPKADSTDRKRVTVDAPGVHIDIDKKDGKGKVDVDVGPKKP